MAEVFVNALNAERVIKFLADKSIVAVVEDRGAAGVYVVGDFDPTPLSTYSDDYVPVEVSSHLQHLRDYLSADPAVITPAQTVHAVKDLIRAVQYLNRHLRDEG